MKRFSFFPEEVPEPSYSIGPMRTIFGLIVAVINPFGQRTDKEVMKKFEVEASEVEEVPITWEQIVSLTVTCNILYVVNKVKGLVFKI